MSKRTIYIIILIALIGISGLCFYFLRPRSNVSRSNFLYAVPAESSLIINIGKPVSFFKQLESNPLIQSLNSIESFNTQFRQIQNFFGFLADDDAKLLEMIRNKQSIFSLNLSGKNDVSGILLINLTEKRSTGFIQNIEKLLSINPAASISSRKYNKCTITEISLDGRSYYIAEQNGIAMLSRNSILVEESIRQINNDLTEVHPVLEPLLKTIDLQADAQVFINHKNIDQIFSAEVSKQFKRKISLLPMYCDWTELDVNLKSDKLLFSGFSISKDENPVYNTVFLNQQPYHSKIERVIPQQTTYFLNLCLSDVSVFFEDYQHFLETQNLFLKQADQLSKIEKITGINMVDLFKSIIHHELASASLLSDISTPNSGKFWIIESQSGNTALDQILEIQDAYVQNQGQNLAGWSNEYRIDDQTSFTIYKFPFDNIAQLLFGNIFEGIKTNWVTVYDNYLVFGDSYETVGKVVRANVLGETLNGSSDYNSIKSSMNSRNTIEFYCNTALSLSITNLVLNDKLSSQIAANEELLKFKALTWQISSTGDMLYNNGVLSYSSEISNKPKTVWQSHIKANFDFKPVFVTNHNDTENKEIVLQDLENNFYLINNVGRVMWQIKLDAPILGEVSQIDYFKNGKLQYLFNTANKLYIVDRDGNFVGNYPINFRTQATNGVAVFDYDNNKDYRFFVACNDKVIYAYQPDGKLLQGWELPKTDHEVTQVVQHFRVEGKDYIVASDAMKDYIMHRTGKIRVNTEAIYPHSMNKLNLEERTTSHEPRIVSTASDGTLHYTYFDGKQETKKLIDVSSNHYFNAGNLDTDEELEYLFGDNNTLFLIDNDGASILKKKMDAEISHPPHVYQFSSTKKKIGIACKSLNKIYLYDIAGNLHNGFPLDGCTEFSIGFISNENTNFNLMVGSPDGYLYNYYVE